MKTIWDQKAFEKLVRMYAGGVPLKEIAKEFGVCVARIHNKITDLRKRGLVLPGRYGANHTIDINALNKIAKS